MRRSRTVLAAILGALIAVVVGVAPAAASTDQPYSWTAAPCADGAITGYQAAPDGSVTISGWIQPCEGTPAGRQFGIMHYTEYGKLAAGLRWYKSVTSPTRFEAGANQPVDALCLQYDYEARLACVAIRDEGGTVVIEPIPVNDPLVFRPVYRLPGDELGHNPVCATCV